MVFEEVYTKYWQKVFRLCMGYINDHDAAKDITQETFIKIWKGLPNFRNESSLGTWVYRIATNTCLRQIQKNSKMPKAGLPYNIQEAEQINIEDEVRFLYQCVSDLPKIERIIISLELEDIDQKEIAKIVGISEGNVRVKIHRIKEKLTRKFKNYER